MAFGWLQLTINLGSIIGGLFSLLIAPVTFMGISGWGISFHLVSMISVVVGILVCVFANDPHFPEGGVRTSNEVPHRCFLEEEKILVHEAKSVINIRSFQIIVAQGVTGSFPWSALSFSPMWLELTGFSHTNTAILIGIFVVANSLGGLFGGEMGDILSKRLPNSGRIILSLISLASAIPQAAILFWSLPTDPSTMLLHSFILLIAGFFISWNAAATNNPIFAERVPEKSRTSIYVLDRSFESVLSSFAQTIVGLLAQYVYGYKPVPEGSEDITTDRGSATSLAKALFIAVSIPMALCCIIYSFLYLTYPRDRERAQMKALIESETQLVEFDSPHPLRYRFQVRSSEMKNLDDKALLESETQLIEFDSPRPRRNHF